MDYKEYKPHPLFSDCIECYWSAYANGFYTLEDLIGLECKSIEEQLFDAGESGKRVEIIEEYLFEKFNDRWRITGASSL